MSRFLKERGASEEVLKGGLDMRCDTCLESQGKPRLSRPGHIRPDLEFNDVAGMDGAYWTNKKGTMFFFTHIIDEGTLYHLGYLQEGRLRNRLGSWKTCGSNGQVHVRPSF